MRIGLTGAGGTGKTTAARLLVQRTGEALHQGMTRRLLEGNWPSEKDVSELSLEQRWRYQKIWFDRKLEQDLTYADGIFDRTLLDHLAYCLLWCNSVIDDSVCRSMVILTQENLERYDLLFYFPPYAWAISDGGLREGRLASRTAADLLIQGLLKETEVEFTTVPNIGPISRADFLLKHIELRKMGEEPDKAENQVLTRLKQERACV